VVLFANSWLEKILKKKVRLRGRHVDIPAGGSLATFRSSINSMSQALSRRSRYEGLLESLSPSKTIEYTDRIKRMLSKKGNIKHIRNHIIDRVNVLEPCS
jgi:hypothetical protein